MPAHRKPSTTRRRECGGRAAVAPFVRSVCRRNSALRTTSALKRSRVAPPGKRVSTKAPPKRVAGLTRSRRSRLPTPRRSPAWPRGTSAALKAAARLRLEFDDEIARPVFDMSTRTSGPNPNLGGRSVQTRMFCGWDCGARLSAREMRSHFNALPKPSEEPNRQKPVVGISPHAGAMTVAGAGFGARGGCPGRRARCRLHRHGGHLQLSTSFHGHGPPQGWVPFQTSAAARAKEFLSQT
jgi:hypothetical protein